MIGTLSGTITHKDERRLILEVGGVGYKVAATAGTLNHAKIGTTLSLFTHLVVREDVLDLYGFTNHEELNFFELLIGISGIGPKSALAILSLAPPETLRRAVGSGNTEYLTQVSGIGRKSAEKIILELRDKLDTLPESEQVTAGETEALEALRSLGYSLKEAREALKAVAGEHNDSGELIKAAIKRLGRS